MSHCLLFCFCSFLLCFLWLEVLSPLQSLPHLHNVSIGQTKSVHNDCSCDVANLFHSQCESRIQFQNVSENLEDDRVLFENSKSGWKSFDHLTSHSGFWWGFQWSHWFVCCYHHSCCSCCIGNCLCGWRIHGLVVVGLQIASLLWSLGSKMSQTMTNDPLNQKWQNIHHYCATVIRIKKWNSNDKSAGALWSLTISNWGLLSSQQVPNPADEVNLFANFTCILTKDLLLVSIGTETTGDTS